MWCDTEYKIIKLEEVEFLYNYAKNNNLLVSCGSDYHGNNRYSLECEYLNDNMINDILSWIGVDPNERK